MPPRSSGATKSSFRGFVTITEYMHYAVLKPCNAGCDRNTSYCVTRLQETIQIALNDLVHLGLLFGEINMMFGHKVYCHEYVICLAFKLAIAPPWWLSGERVGLMTWCLCVRYPIKANFLFSVFSPLTSAEACEKSSRWLWKESCDSTGVRKPRNTCASPTAMI